MTEEIVDNNPKGCQETSVASTLIPWDRDDDKSLFLGYRASGLSVRESLNIIGKSKPWLSLQRHDSEFVDLERRIPEFRKELAKEYVEIEFFRNFRLVLEKDFRILKKSLGKDILSHQEQEYLIKLRTQYTPAQIQIMEVVAGGSNDGFDFAKFVKENPDIVQPGVVQLSRTDTLTIKNRDPNGL